MQGFKCPACGNVNPISSAQCLGCNIPLPKPPVVISSALMMDTLKLQHDYETTQEPYVIRRQIARGIWFTLISICVLAGLFLVAGLIAYAISPKWEPDIFNGAELHAVVPPHGAMVSGGFRVTNLQLVRLESKGDEWVYQITYQTHRTFPRGTGWSDYHLDFTDSEGRYIGQFDSKVNLWLWDTDVKDKVYLSGKPTACQIKGHIIRWAE